MFALANPQPVLAQDADAAVFELNAGYLNAVTVTPAEDGSWTVSTTGSDPYVATSGLTRELTDAETTLTFEYKANVDHNLEIFFSTAAGNKYDGNYSYPLGTAPASKEWKRVNLDITKARTVWGWGKPSYTLRFDPGTESGLEYQIRDIRITSEKADPLADFTIENGAIQVNSQEDFNKWVAGMNGFMTKAFLPDVNVDINCDVLVNTTQSSGNAVGRYNGVMDVKGHTMTLDLKNIITDGSALDNGVAIFQFLYGTFKNATLEGTVEGNGKYLASVAKDLQTNGLIENVTSYVTLLTHISGDGTHGGIVGRTEGVSTLRNVCFAGTIIDGEGGATTSCGGLVGWVQQKTTIEGCLMIGDIQIDNTSCNTIGRNQGNIVGKNIYASAAFNETPASCIIATPEQLASGEVCFALNGEQRNIAWYQTLGEDEVPVLDPTHKQVFANGEFRCDGKALSESVTFNNESGATVPDHEYENGICTVCGKFKEGFVEKVDNYYIVDTPEKLVYMSVFATNNPASNIKITADLDMSEVTGSYRPIRGAYSGIFDGGGHTISNLIIDNVPHEIGGETGGVVNDQALIGLAGGCTVKNLTLDASCSINGGGYSAGFVGETTGSVTITMENLIMHGNVRAAGPNGAGIYGCNMGTTATIVMKNCGVSGNIVGDNEAGALSGWFGGGKATVTNCWFVGSITGCDNETSAVICRPAGDSDVAFTNCWSYQGSRTNVGKLAEDAASTGDLTWKLNKNTFENPTWFQNLDEGDAYPTLDATRGVVYPTADGYATVIESDATSFAAFVKGLKDNGLAYIETEDAQSFCNVNILAEYTELVAAYDACTDLASVVAAFKAEQSKLSEAKSSVTAYKNYIAQIEAVFAELEARDDFSGDDRDFLEGIYLGETAGPGEYEGAPNGTYEYIIETRTLTTKEVNAEIEHVKELMRIAVANGYAAGTELTNMLVNYTFADGTNGWQGKKFNGHGKSIREGSTMCAAEIWSAEDHDMYQEIVVAKDGIYELQVRGGYRPFNDANSIQYSPYMYMNGNANYLQAVKEDYIPVDQAVDQENCYITPGLATLDRPILDEEGDTLGWALHGIQSCCFAFEAKRYDNRLVINATAGDTLRIGVKQTYLGGGANDWVGIGDIHLTYCGEMEESEEAVDRALASMMDRAKTMQEIQVKSDADYIKFPNYTQAIKDRLAAAIAKAEGAADVATKYEVIEELSAVFQEAIVSKMAYKHYFAKVEETLDIAYKALELDGDTDAAKELAAAADAVSGEAIAAYEAGSLTTEEAQACDIVKTLPINPTVDENGAYHVANTAQMVAFTKIVKGGNNKVTLILDGDVNFDTSMMMTDFYGTLDGQDHTINVNIERTADNAAIFENIRGATIKNVVVTGTIITPNKYAAGIAAHAHDASKLYRIQSMVDIQGNIAGDGTHAGIIAVNESGELDMSYCMFGGTMSGTANCNGGLVGWGSAKVLAKNCLVIADITADPSGANIISRNSVEATNCYYLNAYGGAPGGATQVTVEELASGMVAYGLNGQKTRKDVVWRQNLGEDAVPTLDPTHKIVYVTADGTYTNEMQNEIEKYTGTEGDPYIINTTQDMALLRRFLTPGYKNYVKLGADIDMAEIKDWQALNLYDMQYNGSGYMLEIDFDGQGHTISNFTCADSTGSYNSFFGIFCGNVRNVGFKDANVIASNTESGILGAWAGQGAYKNADATSATSRVENVWITGKISDGKGGEAVGAFFGNIGGNTVMKNCYSNVEIVSNANYVGGIAGRVRGELQMDQVYAAGSISTTSETNKVGGIIGGGQVAATSPGFYNNIAVWNNTDENFGATIAAKDVTLPVADLLDVVFDKENIAVDQSPMQQAIEVIGQPEVVYNEQFGTNAFLSAADGTTPVSYLKVPYAGNQAFMDAIADGFTVETTFAVRNESIPGAITPFRATQSGGYGFDIEATGQIKYEVHTDIDGTKAYRYANSSVYVQPNLFYHMVGVYDKPSRKVYVYINGGNAAEGSAEGTFNFPGSEESHWLGIGADCAGASASNGANFEIINARVYSEAISQDVAKALYYKQMGKNFYAGDQMSNISYYDGTNFAALQQIVVDWGKPWTCDMKEGSYPVFEADFANGINSVTNNAKGKIFNINGIQVEKTTKGLYIIDGKKVMVK